MTKLNPHSLSSGRDSTASHSVRRHVRDKKSEPDPFLELSNDFTTTEQPFPRSPKGEDNDVDRGNAVLVDLVLAPLNMITFILSLFLVDRQNRHWRLSQHASSPKPAWPPTHWSYFHPEPYQDADSSKWGHKSSDSSSYRPEARHTGSYQGWYARKKKGAIAKLEIGDAFEMRGRVAMALFAWTVLGVLAFLYAMRRAYIWLVA